MPSEVEGANFLVRNKEIIAALGILLQSLSPC
jgi:hypothetical protein